MTAPASGRRVPRLVTALAGGAVAALAAGATYQVLASWNSRRRHSPPGRMVDIGGHSLHVLDSGSGSPTVVLEAGLTATSAVWGWIRPALAEVTRVVAYDRTGIGWSDASSEPHDAGTVARHLAIVLDRLSVEGPVVLVGHSMGGIFARVFADLFPDRVAGMVLVDPAHPDQDRLDPPEGVRLRRTFTGRLKVAPVLAGLGVLRLSGGVPDGTRRLPEKSQIDVEVFYSSVHHLRGVRDEMLAWDESAARARRSGPLGDRPLLVLSATEPRTGWVSALQHLHEDLARLSSRGEHRLVEGADHRTILIHEDFARVTAAAIAEVLEAARC